MPALLRDRNRGLSDPSGPEACGADILPSAAAPIGDVEGAGRVGCAPLIAVSAAMRDIRAQIEQVAPVDAPVLCLGESGTGKEVVANLVHQLSPRSGRMFLKVNCAALPAELLESELFGHEAGAFTGAVRSKPGKFEMCHRGTLLLDEIADIPAPLQAKLLHVLQDQEFARLGGCSRIQVDVRVIAVTNADVQQAIRQGRLREDLFFRLNAFVFHLPPLRERPEDIPVLLQYFLTQYALLYRVPPMPLSARIANAALRYEWPGNVRELENFAKRYVILGDEELVLSELADNQDGDGFRLQLNLAHRTGGLKVMVRRLKTEVEADAIRHSLKRTNWNRKETSRRLGVSYRALLVKIREYGLDQPGTAQPADA